MFIRVTNMLAALWLSIFNVSAVLRCIITFVVDKQDFNIAK